ncbi:PadR family transcriptional regulator [Deinococcus sonorensis]|uniref:PadR family transcriptional regulator n=1 Tax=Deinococcus sonorensis TaxID=309891 RepID=A0ABV8YAY4_9DEIO
MPDANMLRGNLDLILLMILEDGPKYGLEIINDAQHRTSGYFDFKEGSVYPALHRLMKEGWLRADFQPSPRGGMPARYYALTPEGHTALAQKREAFSRFTDAVFSLGRRSG